MITKQFIATSLVVISIGALLSCKKDIFLEKIPSTSFQVPKTLNDMRNILDNEIELSQTHGLGILSADQFYCTDQFWQTMTPYEREAYRWGPSIYQGEEVVDDWEQLYQQVFYANQVLAGLAKIEKNSRNEQLYDPILGTALFIRAYAFYNLAQVFSLPYDAAIAQDSLGIPLRLTPNISERSVRATIEQTHNQILSDLRGSIQYLPKGRDSVHPNRPSTSAAYAMLARVFLSMRKYTEAGANADSCLQVYNKLIDFNHLDSNTDFSFTAINREVLYQSRVFNSCNLTPGQISGGCFIDSNLYLSYVPDDLRRSIYFKLVPWGKPTFKGSYYGNAFAFTGLATDEVFLIRAECFARDNHIQSAMADLNTLLRHRWRTDYFLLRTASTKSEALQLILEERFKELVLRGQRWTDIRRLNKEGAGIILTRIINGKTYHLPPNDKRYALPIPEKVIRLTGMEQNPR